MSSKRKRSLAPWIASAVLLIGGYVGAYYTIVQMSPGYFVRRKEWRFGQAFFAPIHELDRRFRPQLWKPKSDR